MEEEERETESEFSMELEEFEGEEKERLLGRNDKEEEVEETQPHVFGSDGDAEIEFLQKVLNKMKTFKKEMMATPFSPSKYPPVAVLCGVSFPTPKDILYQGPLAQHGFDFDTLPFGV
jgi:hypothetical protein